MGRRYEVEEGCYTVDTWCCASHVHVATYLRDSRLGSVSLLSVLSVL